MYNKAFERALNEDINDIKMSYKQGGYNKRHHKAKTGSNRMNQNFIPVVHKASGEDNNAIEHLRNNGGASHVCTPQDLIHIINTYIKQGTDEPCNLTNVNQMAANYLQPTKQLGTTGMRVVHNNANNSYVLIK